MTASKSVNIGIIGDRNDMHVTGEDSIEVLKVPTTILGEHRLWR